MKSPARSPEIKFPPIWDDSVDKIWITGCNSMTLCEKWRAQTRGEVCCGPKPSSVATPEFAQEAALGFYAQR
jgi:hypothetical protein